MGEQNGKGISWTSTTWNPIRGCSRFSDGCRNCYAELAAGRAAGPGQPYEGLVKFVSKTSGLGYADPDAAGDSEARWNGTVRMVTEHLADPLRWTRPRLVFVNSMSDLFHESLSNMQIAAVFGVMAASPTHTFQVLTKRSKRMLEWFCWAEQCDDRPNFGQEWPLQNVWLGVSAENKAAWDQRVPDLLACEAAVRWVSVEPQIGDIEPSYNEQRACPGVYDPLGGSWWPAIGDPEAESRGACREEPHLDWIVCGGESGPGARTFRLEWAHRWVQECREADVPVFIKQMGKVSVGYDGIRSDIKHRKGADPAEWPEELRVRQWPKAMTGTPPKVA